MIMMMMMMINNNNNILKLRTLKSLARKEFDLMRN